MAKTKKKKEELKNPEPLPDKPRMSVREYLSAVPDISKCDSGTFWFNMWEETIRPCCPFSHAAVARGLVPIPGCGGTLKTCNDFGVSEEARYMYMSVWDKMVPQGKPKEEIHALALKVAEIVEGSL